MSEMMEYTDPWQALYAISIAAGLSKLGMPMTTCDALLTQVPAIIRHLEGADPMLDLTRRRDNPAADLLAADMKALRAEMEKPLKALSRIHMMILEKSVDGSLRSTERLGRACLWALLGDDRYLTDASDRAELLGPDASGPASGAPQPS